MTICDAIFERVYIVFRNRFLYGFMFVYIYIYTSRGSLSSASFHCYVVWLARPSHLIAGAFRDGKGRSSGSND